MAGNLMFISATDVKSILTYDDLIPAMESALRQFSDKEEGGVVQPIRSITHVAKFSGFFGAMPGFSEHHKSLACKLVSYYPQNKDCPTHNALIVLLDPQNGVPLAVLDGDVITAMRTAAASAVATKCMYKKTPQILAIVGAGVQGWSHYQALSTIYQFTEVRISSRTTASAQKMASQVPNGKLCETAQDAVMGADIIVMATASEKPILKADWVKPGAHINSVGAVRPHLQEIDEELMRSSIVCVDSREAALVESGDIIISQAEIFSEVGELILGKYELPQDKGTTLFKSVGIAIEDVVSAKLVYDKFIEKSKNVT